MTRSQHILFVDNDPAARRSVEKLQTRLPGARLSFAVDCAQARELLARDPVDLLIVDPAPLAAGLELLQAAREWFKVPMLIVTARDSSMTQALAFANGAVDYFAKPIAQGPLLRCIDDLLHNGGPPRTRLEVVSLGGLVRLLHDDRRTCTLRVTAGAAQGALYFSFGNLVDAEQGALVGLPAAQVILSWGEVAVILDTQIRARPRTIDANVLDLLNPANHRAPPQQHHPVLVGAAPAKPMNAAPPRPDELAPGASYFELVERARELLLVGEYDDAERLLVRALDLEPGGRVARQNLLGLVRRRGITLLADPLSTAR